jgi:hypothetical protein
MIVDLIGKDCNLKVEYKYAMISPMIKRQVEDANDEKIEIHVDISEEILNYIVAYFNYRNGLSECNDCCSDGDEFINQLTLPMLLELKDACLLLKLDRLLDIVLDKIDEVATATSNLLSNSSSVNLLSTLDKQSRPFIDEKKSVEIARYDEDDLKEKKEEKVTITLNNSNNIPCVSNQKSSYKAHLKLIAFGLSIFGLGFLFGRGSSKTNFLR